MSAAVLCLVAASSGAQILDTPPAGPSQALGNSGRGGQTLDVAVSTLDAYDDGLDGLGGGAPSGSLARRGGPYHGLETGIAYARRTRRAVFGLSEGSALRYYPTLSSDVGISHAAAAKARVEWAKTKIAVDQTVLLAPFYSFVNFPRLSQATLAELPAVTPSEAVVTRRQRSYGSHAELTQWLGRRTTVSALSTFQNTDFVDEASGLRGMEFAGRLSQRLTRDLGIILGYGYQQGTYRFAEMPAARTTKVRTYDAGLDYNHALSTLRRTAVGFRTGFTEVQDQSGRTDYRFVGTANLERGIGRTWVANVVFMRGVSFIPGFNAPFFSNSVAFSLGGSMTRRVDLALRGGYSTGQLNFMEGSNGNDLYDASARVHVSLTRRLGLSGEYLFYSYRFGSSGFLPPGFPQHFERRAVRVGFDLWVPLIH